MRRQHPVRQVQQFRVHGGFAFEHVEPGRSDTLLAQRARRCRIVDDADVILVSVAPAISTHSVAISRESA